MHLWCQTPAVTAPNSGNFPEPRSHTCGEACISKKHILASDLGGRGGGERSKRGSHVLLNGSADLHVLEVRQVSAARTPPLGRNHLEARDAGVTCQHILYEARERPAEFLPIRPNYETFRNHLFFPTSCDCAKCNLSQSDCAACPFLSVCSCQSYIAASRRPMQGPIRVLCKRIVNC